MAENSKIEWCHHTFNIAWGCVKVSEGCKYCYADSQSKRYGFNVWGINQPRRTQSANYWAQPLKWNKKAQEEGARYRVFCSSMTDVFFDDPTIRQEQPKLWALIEATTHLDWLLLTKRPENITTMIPESWRNQLPVNVWVGTSVEHQKAADERIPHLMEVPAVVRFLSCEPLLEKVDLWDYLTPRFPVTHPFIDAPDGAVVNGMERYRDTWERVSHLHWVIAGGESGPHARPMHLTWARSLRDQCQAAGVAFFFKQWGEYLAQEYAPNLPGVITSVGEYAEVLNRVGKKKAGRLLDGVEHNEFPTLQRTTL